MWITRITILLLVLGLLDLYSFFAFSKVFPSLKKCVLLYGAFSGVILALVAVIYALVHLWFLEGTPNRKVLGYFGMAIILFTLPKLVVFFTLFLEDIFRFGVWIFHFVCRLFSLGGDTDLFIASRRKFISQLALGVSVIPFLHMGYGILVGRYNFKIFRKRIFFERLPLAFDGFKLLQISDAHVGSFDNVQKVRQAISMINDQKADAVCFTGDFVNNMASELDDWKSIFSKIDAKHKFSILGNHDYGDYVRWNSEEEKQENLQKLIRYQKEMGFDLLLNENRFLECNGEKMAVVGVENWGARGFQKHGDLDKALGNIPADVFKVLLSHDPTHWEEHAKNHPKNIDLTLSGHTHGMQFGVEIKGFRWSPSKYIYKHWAGLYREGAKYLYVNRGLGYLGLPMRAGIWPEITVIELKKTV